jgi:hypothetical protein
MHSGRLADVGCQVSLAEWMHLSPVSQGLTPKPGYGVWIRWMGFVVVLMAMGSRCAIAATWNGKKCKFNFIIFTSSSNFTRKMYSVFHWFMQAKSTYGGSILSSSHISLQPQLTLKTTLAIKVVKIEWKIIISLPWSKLVKHTVGLGLICQKSTFESNPIDHLKGKQIFRCFLYFSRVCEAKTRTWLSCLREKMFYFLENCQNAKKLSCCSNKQ